MLLFSFKKDSYEVDFAEQTLMITVFKKIIDRDKTKDKQLALKELTFMWFYADITSPYTAIIDLEDRCTEIKRDIDLPKTWKIDKQLNDAIVFYKLRSKTVIHSLYDSAMIAASAVNDTFQNAKQLIDEAKDKIEATEKVIRALGNVPKVMQNLKEAEKELLRQIEDNEGKKVGSKAKNIFEDGLDFE